MSFSRLSAHPDITISGKKEIGWWSRAAESINDVYDFERYLDVGDIAARTILRTLRLPTPGKQHTTHPMIFGDGTPSTFYLNGHWAKYAGHPDLDSNTQLLTPKFMSYVQPNAKLILILRNPAAMTFSSYKYFLTKGATLSLNHFHECVVLGIELILQCNAQYGERYCAMFVERLMPTNKHSCDYVMRGLQKGQYYYILEEWLKYYDLEQFRIIILERYAKSKRKVLVEIWNWLGLQPASVFLETLIEKADGMNVGSAPMHTMLPQTERLLNRFFQPTNARLLEMLNVTKTGWFI